jgi:hypothetical protein
MVTFQTPDGTPGFHQSDTLDEAITFVERLRNEQGVHNSRIFRMEELKFDFKPYYKVEIASGADNGGLSAPERATPSSRPAPPRAAASLDLTEVTKDDDEAATPEKAPEPVGAVATPAASTVATPPPPPPPPAKDAVPEAAAEAPRRGLFTR